MNFGRPCTKYFRREKVQLSRRLDNPNRLTDGTVLSEDTARLQPLERHRLVTLRDGWRSAGPSGAKPEYLVGLCEDCDDRRRSGKRIELMGHNDVLDPVSANRAALR